MDLVIQKATELGVHRISPVLTDFSVVKLEPERAAKRRDHWQKVAQSACEQCQRNIVPDIDPPQSLLDWFGNNAGSDQPQLILRADAADAMPAIELPGNDLTMLVGPEGGFSEAEYERATVAGLKAVRLGPRIMRTETAALAALSIAQATWGDCRHHR
jgi:16S rRNA (uracil1498-N3)-methyltransferase